MNEIVGTHSGMAQKKSFLTPRAAHPDSARRNPGLVEMKTRVAALTSDDHGFLFFGPRWAPILVRQPVDFGLSLPPSVSFRCFGPQGQPLESRATTRVLMTAEHSSFFLSRRIIIVTGKGGTGKTTVTAALGMAAAHQGLSTLLVEVGAFEQLPRLITGQREAPVGYAGRLLRPGIQAIRIEPFAALAEYLGMQIGSRMLVAQALRNRSLRQLLRGAPGWRELITLGKIWQLEQMQRSNGKPLYDLIVVDAPATGHGLTFLDLSLIHI